jgi:hypothetical protein
MWRTPFTADTWRRTLHAVLALPAGIVSLLLAAVGRGAAAGRIQRGLARRLLGIDPGDRLLGRLIVSLPINVVAFVVTGYALVGVVLNLGYPLRPGGSADDWGGPTLAGRWAVHALGGLLLLYAAGWIGHGFARLQARLLGS